MKNSVYYRLKIAIAALYGQYFRCLDRKMYGHIDDTFSLIPPLSISCPKNIFLYGHACLRNASIYANSAKVIIKEHALIAEGLRISTGNHSMILGRFCADIKQYEKPHIHIEDVIIEADAWIGRNVTILSGVHIGRGCTVGAGAVVSKSLPPYCVAVGVPAKPIKFKWTIDEILQHEQQLYDPDERFSREELEEIFTKYQKE